MYYFDNEFLKKYLELDYNLKIVYNGSVLTIPSLNDVASPKTAVAYSESGYPEYIDYRRISAIYINDEYLDLEGLEKFINGEKEEKPKKDKKTDKKEESVDIFMVGRNLIREYKNFIK